MYCQANSLFNGLYDLGQLLVDQNLFLFVSLFHRKAVEEFKTDITDADGQVGFGWQLGGWRASPAGGRLNAPTTSA